MRLRVVERMSLSEIARATGISQSGLSVLLRSYPLTQEETLAKNRAGKCLVSRKKSHGEESKYHRALDGKELLPQRKGNIAEAAVRFRLELHGFQVFSSPFDGDKFDFIVRPPDSSQLFKLQVRWVGQIHGRPIVRLTCADGHHKRRRFQEGEFDFIIGYYLFNDTAYVYSFEEVADNKFVFTVSEEHAERWDKLKDFIPPAAALR